MLGGVRVFGHGEAAAFDPGPLVNTRAYFYGGEKAGKTTTAAGIPKALIVDFEDKMRLVPPGVLRADYVRIRTLPEFDKLFVELCKGKGCGYDMLVWDTVDEFLYGVLIPGMTAALIAKTKDYPKPFTGDSITEYRTSEKGSQGWTMVGAAMVKYLAGTYYDARMGYLLLGHVKEKPVMVKSGTGLVEIIVRAPALPNSILFPVKRQCVFLGEFRVQPQTVRTKLRLRPGDPAKKLPSEWVAETPENAGASWPTRYEDKTAPMTVLCMKDREPDPNRPLGANVTLPSEIPLPYGEAWAALEKAYNTAIERK